MKLFRPTSRGRFGAALTGVVAAWCLCVPAERAMAAPPATVSVGAAKASSELLAAGKRALEAGHPDRAVAFLERAVQLNPNDEDAQLSLATAQRTDGTR